MYLENTCYICLQKENKLIRDINSSLSVNKDIIDIIGYLPFNLAWLKAKRIILICEQCCLRLRETYEFMEMCLKNSELLHGYINVEKSTPITNTNKETESDVYLNKKQEDINEGKYGPHIEDTKDVFADFEDNSTILQGYMDLENSTPISNRHNEAEFHVHSNMKQEDINEEQYESNIEETEDVFVDLEDSFVKEENTWKREEVDVNTGYSMGYNSTENIDNESDSRLSINGNAQISNTDSVSSGFTYNQVHATDMNEFNTATKGSHRCPTCNKSFLRNSELNKHTRIHTGEKLHSCSICNKCFSVNSSLMRHMRTHTGEKPYECSTCKKCFSTKSSLECHMRIHTGEKPYECPTCKKCFCRKWDFATHIRLHTNVRPYVCSSCKKCFNHQSHLVSHMRAHTGVKPHECSTCKKCFTEKSVLISHMRTHSGEKPYECPTCKKRFLKKWDLARHVRIHNNILINNQV